MTPERWQQIEDLLNQALDVDTTDRLAWLRGACAEDDVLFEEVVSLVASHSDEFLEQPVVATPEGGAAGTGAEPSPLVPELATGAQVDGWRILQEVGHGGMGTVYLAERVAGDFVQKGALKLLHGASARQTVLRFQQERRILAQLNHPSIARLLDGGSTEDGRPYLVMEHVDGEPVDQYCDRHRLDITERLRLFRKICSAVNFFHRSLVLHRDLKPSNILVTESGEPKLLDFGVAKLLAGDAPDRTMAPTALHTGGPAPLTLDYASPEQLRGEPVTTASDVYALGVLLYELLSGHRPHRSTTSLPAKLERLCNEEPEPPSQAVGRDETRERADGSVHHLDSESVSRSRDVDASALRRRLSGDLDSIVLKALEKKPSRRYASVEQLSEDIENYLRGLPVKAHQNTPLYQAYKFVRRNALAVTAAALFVLLLTGFSVYAEILRQRANEAAEQALVEERVAKGVSDFLRDILEGASPVTGNPELSVGELIEQVLDDLPDMLGENPEIRARMLDEVARVFKDVGQGAERVLPLYEEAVQLRRNRAEPDMLDLAQALLNLGGNQRDFGQLKQAEKSLLEGVRLYAQHGTPEQQATAYNQLAGLQRRLGEMHKAEATFRQALELRRHEFGPDSVETAQIEHNLSSLLTELGKLDEAEQLAQHSLEVRRGFEGKTSEVSKVTVATSLANLGRILEDQGRLDEAIEQHRASLELRQEVHKDNLDHKDLAPAYSNLGCVQTQLGELDAAEASFQEALRIGQLPAQPNKLHLASFQRNYADALLARGRAEEAELRVREARRLLEETYEERNPWMLAHIDSTLGATLLAQGKRDAAEPLLRASYETLLQALGPSAAKTKAALQRLQQLETVNAPREPEGE